MKRTNLDKRIAWKARDTGAELTEGFEVGKQNPTFDREEGLWTVSSTEVHHAHLLPCIIRPLHEVVMPAMQPWVWSRLYTVSCCVVP